MAVAESRTLSCKAQEWVLTDWVIAPDWLVRAPPKLVGW